MYLGKFYFVLYKKKNIYLTVFEFKPLQRRNAGRITYNFNVLSINFRVTENNLWNLGHSGVIKNLKEYFFRNDMLFNQTKI
jgi:hypothetical protein